MFSLDQINVLKNIYAFNSMKTYGPYSSNGRKTLIIDMDGKKRCRLLAAWLVEIKFNRKMKKNETVDHIDENKTNDSMDNLQILTRRDNAIKAFKNGKYENSLKKIKIYANSDLNSINHSGEKNGLSKISEVEVKNYRQLFFEKKITIKDIQKETKLHRRTVENFINGKSYENAGGPSISLRKPLNKELILNALNMMEQKIPFKRIAKILEIDRSTLRDRIKKYKSTNL